MISLTIVSAKREDITHGFTKLMVDNQEEVAGFNKSEAMIILFPKLFHNQDKAMRWYQRQKLYSRPTPEDSAIAIRALLNSVDVTKDVHNKVTVPTFIVNGEHDPLIFDKQHYRIDNYFENVRKVYLAVQGMHHILKNLNDFRTIFRLYSESRR